MLARPTKLHGLELVGYVGYPKQIANIANTYVSVRAAFCGRLAVVGGVGYLKHVFKSHQPLCKNSHYEIYISGFPRVEH